MIGLDEVNCSIINSTKVKVHSDGLHVNFLDEHFLIKLKNLLMIKFLLDETLTIN